MGRIRVKKTRVAACVRPHLTAPLFWPTAARVLSEAEQSAGSNQQWPCRRVLDSHAHAFWPEQSGLLPLSAHSPKSNWKSLFLQACKMHKSVTSDNGRWRSFLNLNCSSAARICSSWKTPDTGGGGLCNGDGHLNRCLFSSIFVRYLVQENSSL